MPYLSSGVFMAYSSAELNKKARIIAYENPNAWPQQLTRQEIPILEAKIKLYKNRN